jgi:anaphase-promoting complex subunit 10
LRDDNLNSFWQSDGSQPHLINIQFMKKTRVQEISLYFDFKSDESYTPSKIAIRAGNNLQDLK